MTGDTCEVCRKERATVHLTEIKGGKLWKTDFCESCAKALGHADPEPASISEEARAPLKGTRSGRFSARNPVKTNLPSVGFRDPTVPTMKWTPMTDCGEPTGGQRARGLAFDYEITYEPIKAQGWRLTIYRDKRPDPLDLADSHSTFQTFEAALTNANRHDAIMWSLVFRGRREASANAADYLHDIAGRYKGEDAYGNPT